MVRSGGHGRHPDRRDSLRQQQVELIDLECEFDLDCQLDVIFDFVRVIQLFGD